MADYDDQGLNFSAPNSDDHDCNHSLKTKSIATMCGGNSSSSSRVVKQEPVFTSREHLSEVELGGRRSPSRAREMMMMMMANTSRRPRGRPLGSKNRPTLPIVINKESQSGMKSMVIEIAPGSDVVESLVEYARRRGVGISVLSGCGSVSSVTLRPSLVHSYHASAPAMTLHGPFNLLSLSGSFMESRATCSFGICLAGSQGQVFGGIVGGQVLAASLVMLVAATFHKPKIHKLQAGSGLASGDESDDVDETQLDIKPSLLLGGCATSNAAHETTSCSFRGGSGSGSGCTTTAVAMSTCVYVGGLNPQVSQLPAGLS